MKKAIGVLAVMLMFMSCTDATRAKMTGYGDTFTVIVVGCDTSYTFQSSGKVIPEHQSDGYYFNEAVTGKLIEVSGTVIIKQN